MGQPEAGQGNSRAGQGELEPAGMVTGHGELGPGYGELESAGTATAHGKLKLTGTGRAGTGTGKAGTDDWTGIITY